MTRSLAVVAFAADRPLSPRGERAHAVARAARRVAETELIGPTDYAGARRRVRQLSHLGSRFLLDAWEAEAWWTLRRPRLRPRGRPQAALLVGFPFSAVYWAARWLVREDVRYVVDLGDPWALTLPAGERPLMGAGRAPRCEEFVWRSASGGVLTTELQADVVRRRFPQLPVAVRPNGYLPMPRAVTPSRRGRKPRTLRLVHYGNLYQSRLPIVPLLSHLAQSGRWDSIVFTQQGEDWTGALRGLPAIVRLEVCPAQSWERVVGAAAQYDLAVVVGNHNPAQLPSKAVQYLTLPIPRLAVVNGRSNDSLTAYVSDQPGWLPLPWDASVEFAGNAVDAHLAREWSSRELAPPRQESWEAVAEMLVQFTLSATTTAHGARGAHPASRAIAAATSSHPR